MPWPPTRIVRLLPWINYDDYLGSEVKLFLRPRDRMPPYPGKQRARRFDYTKRQVVALTRQRLDILDRYVRRKERDAAHATPVLGVAQPTIDADRRLGDALLARLAGLPAGQAAAADYQRLVYEILNFLFEPELTNGELEVETFLKTERRDIVYTNESDRSFWQYVRQTYGSPVLMFEVKNVGQLELEHINQTAAYLGARLGSPHQRAAF